MPVSLSFALRRLSTSRETITGASLIKGEYSPDVTNYMSVNTYTLLRWGNVGISARFEGETPMADSRGREVG